MMGNPTPNDLVAAELRRLRAGSAADAPRSGLGLVEVAFPARAGDVAGVIGRATEVMISVDEHASVWPTDDAWPRLLPEWFVQKCAREKSASENEAWKARWRRLTEEERRHEEATAPWSLLGWLYWLEPERRQWFWWTAQELTGSTGEIVVEAMGWPTPIGSLKWLLSCAGAIDVAIGE